MNVKVRKLDAGVAQLKEAIRLFFEKRDPIAVHSLAGAASSLLVDLGRYKDVDSCVRGSPHIRDDKRGLWIKKINEAQNFFKHADKDPEKELEFNPFLTQMLILEGCFLVEALTGKMFPEALLFVAWFGLKHPELLLEGSFKEQLEAFHLSGIDANDFEAIQYTLQNL